MDVTDKDGVAGVCGVPRFVWLAPPHPVTNEEVESPKMAESEAKRTKRVMAAHNYSHELMVDDHDEVEITQQIRNPGGAFSEYSWRQL